MQEPFDIAIIGGGINGCGCAADAAMRGLKVILLEKGDLACQTSSCSTKLIHGGLRYLEQLDFSLVRKALIERQTLLQIAPSLVNPMPFVLPKTASLRPMFLLKIGLFIYDHLSSNNTLPKSKGLSRINQAPYFIPLTPSITRALLYYDCHTEDTRLTIANALQAKRFGATIRTQTSLVHAEVKNETWNLTIQNTRQCQEKIQAKVVINATGPWVAMTNQILSIPNHYQLSLVKGSHLVVNKLYEGEHCYVLQHHDRRIIFITPYFNYSLIGTTDVPVEMPTETPMISEEESQYLIDIVNQYFEKPISHDDILHRFSGIRPLIHQDNKSATQLSRDYVWEFSKAPAPHIVLYGGKITTYRLLAEEAIDSLRAVFPMLKASNTRTAQLPSTLTPTQRLFFASKYSWLPTPLLNHYLGTYGDQIDILLNGYEKMSELGSPVIPELFPCEIDYLVEHEWATSLDDIIWRRTKRGLSITLNEIDQINQYLQP